MGERRIDFTDDSRGIFGNHIVGHAYIDDDTNEITFTDDSRGILGNKIIGHGYVDNSHGSGFGETGGFWNPLSFCVGGFVILGFIVAIPISWKILFSLFEEYPVECMLWFLIGVATCFIAYKHDGKTAMLSCIVFGTFLFLIIGWSGLTSAGDVIVFFIGSILLFSGYSVIPILVAKVIKWFVKNIQ